MKINLTKLWDPPYDWVRLELWTLKVARTEPSAAQASQPRHQLLQWFLPLSPALGSQPWLPVFPCLSLQSCGQPFACVLTSRMDPRRAVHFSDCSAFYLLAPVANSKLLICGPMIKTKCLNEFLHCWYCFRGVSWGFFFFFAFFNCHYSFLLFQKI